MSFSMSAVSGSFAITRLSTDSMRSTVGFIASGAAPRASRVNSTIAVVQVASGRLTAGR